MRKLAKAIAAIMLVTMVVFAAGCTPEDDPNNGGGNNSGGIGTCNGHEYVDLGLPSGTLWATCNVGATTPEGYGDNFAWGETETKTTYNWSTYNYCNGSSDQLFKYCNNSNFGYNGFADTLTTLLSEDDAAAANWGSGWCIPTSDQWRELEDNTNSVWITQDSVNGRLFTASNGNSLFLPAAGNRWDISIGGVGASGFYWSNLLAPDGPSCSWCYYFYSEHHSIEYTRRYIGQSVRAVRSARQN